MNKRDFDRAMAIVKYKKLLQEEIGDHEFVYDHKGIITIVYQGKRLKVYMKNEPLFDTSIRVMTESEFAGVEKEYANVEKEFDHNNMATPIVEKEGFPKLVMETESFLMFEAWDIGVGRPMEFEDIPDHVDKVRELMSGLDDPHFLIGANLAGFRILENGDVVYTTPFVHMHYPLQHKLIYAKQGNKKYLITLGSKQDLLEANPESFTYMSGSMGNKDDFVIMDAEDVRTFGKVS